MIIWKEAKVLGILWATGTLFSASGAWAVDDLSLIVSAGSDFVMPGETVSVTLNVANLSTAINGVQALIGYDNTLMSLTGITPNTSVGTGWTEIGESDSSGDVTYVVVMLGGSTSSNHTVAALQFTALIPGTTTVVFRTDEPPLRTKLTKASDGSDILPAKHDSGTIVISCDDTNECTTEIFNGAACEFQDVPAGTACGNPADTICDDPDTCDGAGTCESNLEPPTTECRPAIGDCDAMEFCTGSSAQCPVDLIEPNTVECRPSLGACDPAEFCTGGSVECPMDLLDPPSTVCRPAAGVCDLAESCTGSSADCPADQVAPDGTPCPDGLFCNGAELCDSGVCEPGGDPCPAQECDEAADVCCTNYPYGDVNLTTVVDVDDILILLDGFADPESFPEADIFPCGGDGIIDVDDILAELDAFSGIPACPDPCV